jgi:hypothetical protein
MDLNLPRSSCGLDRPEVHVTHGLNVAFSALVFATFQAIFWKIFPKKPFEMVAAHFQISEECNISHKTI